MPLVKKMAIMGNGSMGLVTTVNGSVCSWSKWIIRPSNYRWIDFVITTTILFQDVMNSSLMTILDPLRLGL